MSRHEKPSPVAALLRPTFVLLPDNSTPGEGRRLQRPSIDGGKVSAGRAGQESEITLPR